jgi:putative endopeptidase
VDQRVRTIVEQLAAQRSATGVGAKVGAYYRSYVDTAAIDRAGMAPLKPLLAEIDALASLPALAAWQGRVQGRVQTPVWIWAGFADFKEPGINRPMAWQGGLGLPDRDYYLNLADPAFAKARAAYLVYLETLARLAGMAQPAAVAQRVLAVETRIATAHVPLAEARDPGRMYVLKNAAELPASAPGYDWAAFLRGAAIGTDVRVMVAQQPAASAIAALYQQVPLAQWKEYSKLHLIDATARVLPRPFRDAHSAFHDTALNGAPAAAPRWRQGIAEVGTALGDAVSELYVERHFPPAHKARVEAMVANILAAFRSTIGSSTMLSEPTRAQALAKLAKYKAKIGHPAHWTNYSALAVRDGDALGNWARARQFDWQAKAAAAGRPIDRAAWMMSPLEVNAFYDPSQNEINLTAGILQAPLFDMEADDAANYGGIGVQIAHEISHGFDTMGAQFDGDGVLRNWWTDADRKAFDAIGARLAAQYSAYEVLPGKHVDGTLSLPENMADLAGLQMAFQAYRATQGGQIERSGEQRFFKSFAQSWRVKMRAERQAQLLASDPHAPAPLRANGTAVNLDAFHDAFGTSPGDGMYKAPAERIRIW